MTQKQIQQGNKLIAEFMGGEFNMLEDGFGNSTGVFWFLPGNNPNPHCNAGTYKRPHELQYNSRWDWLIPVVKKICVTTFKSANENEFHPIVQIGLGHTSFDRSVWSIGEKMTFVSRCTGETMIDHCWYAVIDAINFYNKYSDK